jgi:hypothetical protein
MLSKLLRGGPTSRMILGGLATGAVMLSYALSSDYWAWHVNQQVGEFALNSYQGLYSECFDNFCHALDGGLFFRLLELMLVTLVWALTVFKLVDELKPSWVAKYSQYATKVWIASGAMATVVNALYALMLSSNDSLGVGYWLNVVVMLSYCSYNRGHRNYYLARALRSSLWLAFSG